MTHQQGAVAERQSETGIDAGRAAQAAEATAKAADDAAKKGEAIDDVVKAANIIVRAYEVIGDAAGARAAQAVANAAIAKANRRTRLRRMSLTPQELGPFPSRQLRGNSPVRRRLPTRDRFPTVKGTCRRTCLRLSESSLRERVADRDGFRNVGRGRLRIQHFRDALPRSEPFLHIQVYRRRSSAFPLPWLFPVPGGPSGSVYSQSSTMVRAPKKTGTGSESSRCLSPFFRDSKDVLGNSERNARFAAWTGARAVLTQLVSLANPGFGHSVSLAKNESLVVGLCSFTDAGEELRYDWAAFQRREDSLQRWMAFTVRDGEVPGPQQAYLIPQGHPIPQQPVTPGMEEVPHQFREPNTQGRSPGERPIRIRESRWLRGSPCDTRPERSTFV